VRKPPLNTLDPELYDELGRVSAELEADEETRAIVFASGVENVFIAGADIKQMAGYRFEREPLERKIELVHATFQCLANLSKPTVAAITGHALGGGANWRSLWTSALCPRGRRASACRKSSWVFSREEGERSGCLG
jgi:enoyl-CoA hydratase